MACILGRAAAAAALLDGGASADGAPFGGPFAPIEHLSTLLLNSPHALPSPTCDLPPLLLACGCGHAGLVRLLLRRGADACVTSRDGCSANDFARRTSAKAAVVQALRSGALRRAHAELAREGG